MTEIEVKQNGQEKKTFVEQIFIELQKDEQFIAEQLGISGDELDSAIDSYIVDKAEHNIDADETQEQFNSDFGEAAIRTISEVSDKKTIETPSEQLADDGFKDEVRENAVQFADQRYRGFNIRDSITRIIENQQVRHSDKVVGKAADLLYSGDYRNKLKFEQRTRAGKIDISDERLTSLYLQTIGSKTYFSLDQIDDIVQMGIPLERIAKNEHIADMMVNQTIEKMNEQIVRSPRGVNRDGMFSSPNLKNDSPLENGLIQLLIKEPKYREKIASSVDIHTYGMQTIWNGRYYRTDNPYYDEKNTEKGEVVAHNLENLQLLGFRPFSDNKGMESLFIYAGEEESIRFQKNLEALGLIDKPIVDQMYKYKFNLTKECVKKDERCYKPGSILLDFEPSEDNIMANYWRNQSKILGKDSMNIAMSSFIKIAQEHDIFSELSRDEIYKQVESQLNILYAGLPDEKRAKIISEIIEDKVDQEITEYTLFDQNGLPTKAFFKDKTNGMPMWNIKHINYEYRSKEKNFDYKNLLTFLTQNIDMIDGENKGFIKEYLSLSDDASKRAYILYATGGHNTENHLLFDENGATENFYRVAFDTNPSMQLISDIEGWQKHYSECEVSYINFIKNHIDININIPLDEVADYFDNNGPIKNLYQKLFYSEGKNGFIALLSLENFEDNLNISQRTYLDFMKNNDYPVELIKYRNSVDNYFDDKGPTIALADVMYKNGQFSHIQKMAELPELVGLCSPLRQKYLEFLKQSGFQRIIFELRPDTESTEYFDAAGATPKIWQLEFDNGYLDFILSRSKEESAEMQFNEKQTSVLELYSEINNNGINISEVENLDNEALNTLLKMPDKRQMVMQWLNFPPELREMEKTGQFVINEKNILSYLCAFINLDANDWGVNGVSDIAKSFIKEAFEDTANKNMATNALQKHWNNYLKSDNPEDYPAVLQLMAQHNLDNDGAGQLSQVDVFLDYMAAFQSHKSELFDSAKTIEKRLKKERWDASSISDFYNVSSEVITASPDIYKDFIEFFNGISDKKDFDGFVKEIYPLYKAELTLQAKYTSGGWSDDKASKASYSHLDIEKMRTNLNNTLLVYNLQELSPERRQDGIHRVREIILADIKELFSSKFSIVESAIPNEFSPADIRVMTDMAIYQSNLAERSPEKESLIGFFAALQLNKDGSQTVWDKLRQGGKINASDFLTSEKAESINVLLAQSRKDDPINAVNTRLNGGALTEFKSALQQEIESFRIGSVQTIDMRLSNLIGNIEELCDPDLYPETIDKRRVKILGQFPAKTVSAVSAKMYQSASGREINFSNEELSVRSKLAELLNDENIEASTENIKKYLQDGFNLVKLPFNVSQNIVDNHARDEIIKLQQMLSPSPEIMSIFNQIGEQFSTQSGTLALSADLDFLENLVVKRENDLSTEEKEALREYISLIREQMLKLEQIYDSTVTTFSKTEKSIHTASPELAAKTEQISRIINSTTDQKVITTVCSNQMTTIIENMRQCLSAKSAGINNDTDLTFGEGYKFYLYSHNETNPKGSISDEIIYLIPTENKNGERRLSFVMDKLYGQKTSDVFLGHTETLIKKMKILHKKFPDVNISIFIPNNAMASASLNSELLAKNLGDSTVEISTTDDIKVTVPASAFGDHYIEFIGSPRATGENIVSGTEIKIKHN